MARYEDIAPEFLAKLFEERIKEEVQKVLEEAMKDSVSQATKKVMETISVTADSYRSFDRFGEDIRITLVDKRSKDA